MSAVFPTDYPNDVDDLPMDRQVSQLRIPPHSIEAESSVLGGLLLDNGAWDRVGDLLIDSEPGRGSRFTACFPARRLVA